MRRIRIWLSFLLLAVEVIWLAMQPLQTAPLAAQAITPGSRAPVTAVQAHGLTAWAEQDSVTLTFRLNGHERGVRPTLSVKAGDRSLDEWLRFPEYGPTGSSYRMSYYGVEMYPARVLTYTWEVEGKQVTGEYVYVHPKYPFDWKREKRGSYLFYHTGTLTDENVEHWTKINSNVAGYLSLPEAEWTVYVLPDAESLQQALGGKAEERQVVGVWSERLQAALVINDYPPLVLEQLLSHELAHAYLYNGNPIWWEEGIATWVQRGLSSQILAGANNLVVHPRFTALRKVMETEGTFLVRSNHSQKEPLDPYTVGLSFCFYLQSRFGEEGVLKLAAAAAERPLGEMVQELFGETPDQLEQGWREYVISGELEKAVTQ